MFEALVQKQKSRVVTMTSPCGEALRRRRTGDRNVLRFAASSDGQQFVREETVPLKVTRDTLGGNS